jgi:hypothetical protein
MIMPDHASSNTWVADRTAGRNLKIDAAQRGKTPAYCFSQTHRLSIVSRQTQFEQLTRLLLHGTAVSSGAHAEPALGVLGKFADGNAGHILNDIIDGNDCNEDQMDRRSPSD